jgi:hypothetical protein
MANPTRPYPGTVITIGAATNNSEDVVAIQKVIFVQQTGVYGETTAEYVGKFQASQGIQTTAEVGEQTWNALFSPDTIVAVVGPTAMSWGRNEGGYGGNPVVYEDPLSSNWGPRVSQYIKAAGFSGPCAWCMCFVMWCLIQASKGMGVKMPMPLSGSCSGVYNWAKANNKLVKTPEPGDIFLVRGGDTGYYHCGFVTSVNGDRFSSVEGNSNNNGSSDGIMVAIRSSGRANSSCAFVRV